MDINKVCIILIVLVASLGITCVNSNDNAVYGAGSTWIQFNNSSVGLSNLNAKITVTIKNSGSHVEYFKISNIYTGSLAEDDNIQWVISDTNPKAVKMVNAVNPQLDGDWGWKVQPGETKTVTFRLYAVGIMGTYPTHIANADAVENKYWPIIPDPGLAASWFQPNEIEMLNPNLDLKSWKGTFHFKLTNRLNQRVSGIIRAPVVPTDSKLTYSNPQATFKDRDLVLNGAIAAWDVNMDPNGIKWFTYSYAWPSGSSSSSSTTSSTGTYKSPPTTSAASETSPVSTKDTGVPYIPFILGGILVAGGLVYAGFRK